MCFARGGVKNLHLAAHVAALLLLGFADGSAWARPAQPTLPAQPAQPTQPTHIDQRQAAPAPQRAAAIAVHDQEDPLPYLVAPFENQSPAATLSWMGAALPATLGEKLEAHPRLRPAYGAHVLAGLPVIADGQGAAAQLSRRQAAARARELGARLLIAGAYNRVDWRYQVTLRLYEVGEADLKEVARFETRAPAATTSGVVLELLDQAALGLLAGAGVATEPEVRAALLRQPTRDAYAMTLYGRALLAYDGLAAKPACPEGCRKAELEKIQKTLQRVCFIDPRFAEAHRLLGLVSLEMGEAGKAMGQYGYALDLRPDYYAALFGLGQLYQQAGNRARAQETLERALRVRPYEHEARLTLGKVLFEGGHLPEAQAELSRVVQARPEHVAARRALALVYAASGQVEQLAAELVRIAALLPDDVEVRADLGAANARMGQVRPAIAAYEEVLARRPRHVQAHRMLGDLYRKAGEPERAVGIYGKWMKMQPEDPRPYFLLASTYVETGQEARAERLLNDAQQFRRYLGEAWTDLGVLALRRNDTARAMWYLSRAVTRAPARPKARYNYGLVLDRSGQPERALAELRAAAELDPSDAEIPFAQGAILARQGRMDEARRAFAEALQLRPDHEDARHNLQALKRP
jgi:tetratricopeptide (TPR) repeat protein